MATSIYASPHNEVVFKNNYSSTLVVSVSERKEPKPADYLGQKLFEKERLSYVCVRSLDNTWYLDQDIPNVVETIKKAIRDSWASKVVIFGFSMGSFGALRIAASIDFDLVFLCAPVVTLDKTIESRWSSDYEQHYDAYLALSGTLLPPRNNPRVVVVYDPESHDAKHVEILSSHAKIEEVLTPKADHLVMTYLKSAGVLGDVFRKVVYEDDSLAGINSMIRRSQKTNKAYLTSLFFKLRHRPRLQRKVAAHLLQQFPEDEDVRLTQAVHLARSGSLAEAADLILRVTGPSPNKMVSVAVVRAVAFYAENGGKPEPMAKIVAALKSDRPRSRLVQLWFSRYLRYVKDYDAAFRSHEFYMKGDDFEAHAHMERGYIFERLDLPSLAEKEFVEAYHFAPNLPSAKEKYNMVLGRQAKA
ncbi:MAG: hypothetical protein LBE22_04490 [Azoarcus sp.]|jgi:predicted esterase|nr:hypothetical protein [Azoarcus sp.]